MYSQTVKPGSPHVTGLPHFETRAAELGEHDAGDVHVIDVLPVVSRERGEVVAACVLVRWRGGEHSLRIEWARTGGYRATPWTKAAVPEHVVETLVGHAAWVLSEARATVWVEP